MEYSATVKAVRLVIRTYRMRLTLRQIYYRLVSKNVIGNTPSNYKQLSKVLVKARERGEIGSRVIEDRSRQVLGVGDYGYSNPEDFLSYQVERLKASGENYTRPFWESQPYRLVLALEKDALSRLFLLVANRFRVKVYVTKGYGSFTYVKNMAEEIVGDRPTYVLYFGDYDPSGRDIERDLGRRLEAYGALNLMLERIALTEAQIEKYGLPPRPEDLETLKKLSRDTRAKRYGLEYAVELDAIDPKELQTLITTSIASRLDLEKWQTLQAQISVEKTSILEKLKRVRVTFEEG